MTVIISTTHDPLYQFFLPITIWCWNKLGVSVQIIAPLPEKMDITSTENLALGYIQQNCHATLNYINSDKNKEATYAQCSRLFGGALELPKDEMVIVSDMDMLLFKVPPTNKGYFTVFGADLTPPKQYPMCYISAEAGLWNTAFNVGYKSLQQCLDGLLGHEDCENMRGNLWGRDQETAHNVISQYNPILVKRAREGTQFATHRIDRDDAYFLDRLNWDVVDYHMHRPGYTAENVEKIIKVISYFYPYDDLTWIREYAEKYRELV